MIKNPLRTQRTKRGFSLIEMMVTICVVSIAIVSVLQAISSSVAAFSLLQRKLLALEYAQDAFNALEIESIKENGIADPSVSDTVSVQGKAFQWTVEAQDFFSAEDNPLFEVRGVMSWQKRGIVREVSLYSVFPRKKI